MGISVENQVSSLSLQEDYLELIPHILCDFFYTTQSDFAVWYSIDLNGIPTFKAKRGVFLTENITNLDIDLVNFVLECREILVQNSRENTLFPSLFLHNKMNSILLCPVCTHDLCDIILLNSLNSDHYGRRILIKTEELINSTLETLIKYRK